MQHMRIDFRMQLSTRHGAGALAPDDIQATGKNLIERYNDELECRNSQEGHWPSFFSPQALANLNPIRCEDIR